MATSIKIFPFPFSADHTVADQEAGRVGCRRISVRVVNSDRWEKTRTANKVFSKFFIVFNLKSVISSLEKLI